MKEKINRYVQALADEIENTMVLLEENKFIYFHNPIKINPNGKYTEISCNNHIPGRANCGEAFTTFPQYETILKNGNFCCILYDGSLIKLELCFENQKLISHSYLWWPAPYKMNAGFVGEQTPQFVFEDFVTDNSWFEKISMRSPIRVDFDSGNDKEGHPAVHLHTQHHDSRMKVNKPICFNRFMRFIIENYYPDRFFDFEKWYYASFKFDEPNKDINKHTCLVLT